jgi:hypothetical protein
MARKAKGVVESAPKVHEIRIPGPTTFRRTLAENIGLSDSREPDELVESPKATDAVIVSFGDRKVWHR